MMKGDGRGRPRVAIAKAASGIEPAVKEALALIGGMESLVGRGEEVYLKPNFVAPRPSSTGATTDLEVVRVVAEAVHRCGGIPVLYETPALEFSKEKVYEILKIYEFAEENGIRVPREPLDLIKVPVPDGRVLKSLRIPGFLQGAKIINIPKLKTHVSAKMTCAMKNMIGLLPDSEKRRVHVRGVNPATADLSRVFRPVLTVVDAMTCMQGDGPAYGDRVELGLIVAGTDMVSTDTICGQIIGLPVEELRYLQLLEEERDGGNIEVLGEPLSSVRLPFRIPRKSRIFHACFRSLYAADVVFSRLFGRPLNEFLYSTGYVGTNPRIIESLCNRCGDCQAVCGGGGAIDLERYGIDHKTCIRCLSCYEACREEAIVVRGVSRPESRT